MKELTLNGVWQFTSPRIEGWLPGRVPGEVFSDLIRNDEIPDPYYGDNELDLQWVGKTDWTYRRSFELEEEFLSHRKQVLDCKGLDTVSELYLNGAKVGRSNNMHRRYEFEVGEYLQAGENTLEVQFTSPVQYGIEKSREYEGNIPDHRYLVDQPARQFVRKAQCHYGWDWGPCFPTMGIWRDIALVGFSSPRVRYTVNEQTFGEAGQVSVEVRIGLDVPEAGDYNSTLKLAGEEITEEFSLGENKREISQSITVSSPDLWWPAGYGDQPLYDLTVSVEGNSYHSRVGFRDIELVTEEDSEGESFYFRVNGTPIFAKGANWIPADSFPGRMTERRYRRLIDSAVEANMNCLRIWGGGIYEDGAFYQACDEKGILVWQDFMFACSAYPANEAFLDNVKEEIRYQVRRLADHPSIALWCGNNENEWLGARGDYDAEKVDWEDLKADYHKLNEETVGAVVREEDSDRSFWPSSPSSRGEAPPNDQSIGDNHYWDVWHEEKPFSDYLTTKPRFVSEFGYQSFPSTELLLTAMEEGDLNPTSPIMEHHQRHPEGNKLITRRMTDHFRFPFSFDDFVYLSQVQQGLAMKTAIEHWRRLKPHSMGAIYWQLNDIWPVASWSSLEYGGGWKALQYMAKRFYSPLLVSTMEKEGRLKVWITSDVDGPLQGKLGIEVVGLDGKEVFSDRSDIQVAPLSSEVHASYDLTDMEGEVGTEDWMVKVAFTGPGHSSCNFHFMKPFKSLDLPRPGLSSMLQDGEVLLKTRNAALFVKLGLPGEKGHFDDNYFHLLPGEERQIEYHSSQGEPGDDLEESDLVVTNLRETY